MKTLQDLTAPAAIERNLLEKDVQKQCVDWARARGYWARKFSSQSQRSVPDYLFALGRMEHWTMTYEDINLKIACEFKKPGTKPKLLKKYGVSVMSTEAQYEEQQAMQKAGWLVFECDNFADFKRVMLEAEMNAREDYDARAVAV